MIDDVWVHGEDRCRIDGQGAVDVDRNAGDLLCPCQGVQVVHDLLRTADSEGWNQYATALCRSLAYDCRQTLSHILDRWVVTVAIGRLHDHCICTSRGWLRITDDR